ncbi:hypothetical protein Mmc1_1507 [Magnetococcus marinus MC-1]|uniref:DUF2249 domain-containing protein n=1 Tax=Magnetococcus marinus (strain ATCC BAA-1437 / JCM 17883 / MC-1) TaxID=156889 RepID=A0L7S3_MAGMM|nr:DUF2249 domain-containing protein [Magnetococcus marinus]ABK44016.1 hypothetical protein Mmc1_1507 [Magnetococcus marinus MC-1]
MSRQTDQHLPKQVACNHPCKPLPSPLRGSADIDPAWYENPTVHQVVDVRELPPPQPLSVILEAVVGLPVGKQLIVYHNRMPALLYPRLQERGLWADTQEDTAIGVVLIRIAHQPISANLQAID